MITCCYCNESPTEFINTFDGIACTDCVELSEQDGCPITAGICKGCGECEAEFEFYC